MQTMLRILSYLKRYWWQSAIAYICLMLGLVIDLIVPGLIQNVIDCGIRGGEGVTGCPEATDPMLLVRDAALLMMGLTVLKGALTFWQTYLAEYGAQGIAYDIRNDLYRHLQKLSFSWHDKAHTGELMARATSDVEQLRNFTGRAFIQLAQTLVMAIGITIVLLFMNWKLAIVSLLVVPLLFRVVVRYNMVIRPVYRAIQEELSKLAAIVQENLAGAKIVRAFAREPEQIEKFDVQNDVLLQKYVDAAKLQAFTNPLTDVLANTTTVIVLWLGGYLIINGELSVGQLVAFNTYLLLIIRPVRRIGFMVSQGSRAQAAAERLFDVLDAPVTVEDSPHAIAMPAITGHVRFEDVHLSYYGGTKVLDGVTFDAEPGEIVALLGATGSGKTSIINLIPRFYDISDGKVLIDGYDVRDVKLNSLRTQIGMVLQDTTLFSGTVRENIAFGVPNATDEDIIAMAKAARAHDFIMGFPEGYQTIIGERGVTLSGGQKQRVAIARALLLNPRILILDDFTSAVDTETEALIRQALDVLMQGRTTFVIAQRVSTVQVADKIIVLDHGKVEAIGTHAELLESNPIYAEIYRLQLMDETVEELLEAERRTLAGIPENGHHDGALNGATSNGHAPSTANRRNGS